MSWLTRMNQTWFQWDSFAFSMDSIVVLFFSFLVHILIFETGLPRCIWWVLAILLYLHISQEFRHKSCKNKYVTSAHKSEREQYRLPSSGHGALIWLCCMVKPYFFCCSSAKGLFCERVCEVQVHPGCIWFLTHSRLRQMWLSCTEEGFTYLRNF